MAKVVAKFQDHKDRAWCVAWNPQGTILASCSSDRSIRLHSKENGEWVCKTILPEAHSRTVRSVSWSPCGRYFASSSFDSTVNIWDGKGGEFEAVATLEGHENEVKSVVWSPSGSFLATCSRDKSVWVWEQSDDDYECLAILPAHSQDVKRVVFSPDSKYIVSASYDNTLKVYKEDDDSDWTISSTMTGHESTVWCCDFNLKGDKVVSGSSDNTLRIWQRYDPGNSQGIKTVDGEPTWKSSCVLSGEHNGPIYDVSWCGLNDTIATACGDDTIRLFKETPGCDKHSPSFDTILTIPEAHNEDINCVAWNPVTAGLLATASDDGSVKIWDLTTVF